MQNTKPSTIGIIYRPINQCKFLVIFDENVPRLNARYQ